MDIIVSFLLKSFMSSLVLTAWYWLFLRNKKLHQYNRFYLLMTIILSLVIPLFQFSWIDLSESKYDVLTNVVNSIGGSAESMTLLQTITVLVSSLLLLMLFIRIFRLYRIKQNYPSKNLDGYHIVETQLEQAPFSFLNNLFWRTDISVDDDFGKKIYCHELTHIREKHTYDKLFSQITTCLFWMNPVYWIIQKELNMVHEFIADEKSIHPGDTETFACMLLQSYDKGRYLNPTHSFFHSPIKRRLMMIADSSISTFSQIRKISVLPIIAFVVLLCSFTIDKVQNDFLRKQRDEKLAAEKMGIISLERAIKK